VLLVTGQQSVFNDTTRALHMAIVKTCEDKGKVEFIEILEVANVLEEKVHKFCIISEQLFCLMYGFNPILFIVI